MKRLTLLLSLFLISTGVLAQQTIKSESLSSFSNVSVSGNISTVFIPSDTNKVEIQLSQDVDISKFKWGIANGLLSVSLRSSQGGKGHAKLKIYYADTMRSISISGGELTADSNIKSEMLKVSASGGAKINVGISTLDAELEITGNSAAQISGETKYLTLRATDKSKVDTRQMECVSADVETSSSAEIYIYAKERLVANAKTGSTIFYKGNPPVFKNLTSKMNASMMGSSVLSIGE